MNPILCSLNHHVPMVLFTFSPSIWPPGRATGTSLAWRAHLRHRDAAAAVDGAGFGTALEMVYFMEN